MVAVACGDRAQPALEQPPAVPANQQHVVESQPTMKDTQPVTLNVKFAKTNGRLEVHYEVHNGDKAAILLFNRLHGGGHPREADSQQVYRFVEGGVLRLLLGPAPLPSVPVTFKNVPEVTRIEPYTSFEADLSLPVPVTEYSVYSDDVDPDKATVEQVHAVELFAIYTDATRVETIPSKVFPGAFTASSPGTMHTVASGRVALSLEVMRQMGDFSRFEPR